MAKNPNRSSFEAILDGVYTQVRSLAPEGGADPSSVLLGFAESDENEEEISRLLGKRVRVTIELINE